ncbi:hypothetical protein EV193_10119 [Herbihabitans rhizosphaerae]|uniref:Uncharacterized protein n=1 Tax=Herbihabitans rhizosphaerae TaxID=1872711 RepID=A0A4Q7L4E4_9PSEU|nr:DUF6086 family protein [Herbihabitans rhizosphaerae]RZS44145.1 hypothetical protein EV193_10119 [Herbihabitans rhizosphaerae]
MSYVFDVGDDTVWSPALRVGRLYVAGVTSLAEVFGIDAGLRAVAADMYSIDLDAFEAFTARLFAEYFRSHHDVARLLLAGVLQPSLIMLERAGRAIEPEDDEQRRFLSDTKEFLGSLPRL